MNNRIYVVGGSGYIGRHLCPALVTDGWDVVNIDAGVYGNVAPFDKKDVLDMDPPGDGAPVIWLATIHREPNGFDMLDEDGRNKWIKTMTDIMYEAPESWVRAGHPMIYVSSMSVLGLMGETRYGWAKRMFEARFVGERGVQIIRFGTVWGGLDKEPARVETAINSSLVGKTLTDNYVAYTTNMSRAVEALVYAPNRHYMGTVENVTDSEDPVLGPMVNKIRDISPGRRTVWEVLFMAEVKRAESLKRRLKKGGRRHFTRSLAEYYHLPWPEGLPETYTLSGPAVELPKETKDETAEPAESADCDDSVRGGVAGDGPGDDDSRGAGGPRDSVESVSGQQSS